MSDPYARETASFIVSRDRAFKHLIDEVGPIRGPRASRLDARFAELVQSISHQLLATKAARTIHARVYELCDGEVNVDVVRALGPERLKSVGLSRTKAEAMVELAEHVADGRIDLARHGYMDDEAVTTQVTAVRGIGPWTAQMYLMFTLARKDVWPVGDYGVRHGWSVVHNLDEIVSEKALREVGERFVGVRSTVAHYCWRAVD